MKINVNNKILSIPPYISTSWKHVEGLYMKGATLVATLMSGETINIPGISSELIEMIFNAHAQFLEEEANHRTPSSPQEDLTAFPSFPFGLPLPGQGFPLAVGGDSTFQFGISSMDGFGSAMQHNPAHANAPDLPIEILQKIGAIVKIVAPEEILTGTIAEQDCNCPYCQITRAINGDIVDEAFQMFETYEVESRRPAEKPVENTSPWRIQQIDENQYLVVDVADQKEYRVFLGSPVACTCGQEGCDHIIAVLKS